MEFTDIHTHTLPAEGVPAIYNCSTEPVADRHFSAGIHPWHIDDSWRSRFKNVEGIAQRENCVAIGECGIDRLKGCSIELQEEVFSMHAMLAEESKKPLIIHCVKGIDSIIAIHKEIAPKQAWIIHGFRGKPLQATQLIKAGLYLSFGEQFNNDSIIATPTERIFIESDESRLTIAEIYSLAARARGIDAEELAEAVRINAEKCGMTLHMTP